MNIISQDGDFIVNMNKIVSIEVVANNSKYDLTAYLDDNMELELATYASKDRAKEILEELADCSRSRFFLPEV